MSSCPICLETVISTKASPDVCDHVFCLSCLTKWTKMESFCPVDRKRFKKIINWSTRTTIEVKRGKKRKARALYDFSSICELCKSGEGADTLLLCDSCDLGYHCQCLSPPLSAVPSGRWFCPVCSSIDRRLEQGEELGKKSTCQEPMSFSPNSCSSGSSDYSQTTVNSCFSNSCCSNSSQDNINKKDNQNAKVNKVKISHEDFRTLFTRSQSLFLTPGVKVSSPKRHKSPPVLPLEETDSDIMIEKRAVADPPELSKIDTDPVELHKTNTHNSGSSQSSLNPNLNVQNVHKQEHNVYSSHENFSSRHNPDSGSAQLCLKRTGLCLDFSSDSDDDVFDSEITSSVQDMSHRPDKECVNLEVPSYSARFYEELSRVDSVSRVKLGDETTQNLSAPKPAAVSFETGEKENPPNLLADFEIRSSQYAAKAKMDLPIELKKIEEEKWKRWKPCKRSEAKLKKLLDNPKVPVLQRISSADSKQILNIADYTKKVGRCLHKRGEILDRYKAFVKHNSVQKLECVQELNVFHEPFSFSHSSQTNLRFMNLNPSKIVKKDSNEKTSNEQRLPSFNEGEKTSRPIFSSHSQDLAMREDGSLFLNWSIDL